MTQHKGFLRLSTIPALTRNVVAIGGLVLAAACGKDATGPHPDPAPPQDPVSPGPDDPQPERTAFVIQNNTALSIASLYIRACDDEVYLESLPEGAVIQPGQSFVAADSSPGCREVLAFSDQSSDFRQAIIPDQVVASGRTTTVTLVDSSFAVADPSAYFSSNTCDLSAASGFGVTAQMGVGLLSSFNDAAADAAFVAEANGQHEFWGIPTAVYILNEGYAENANAYAAADGFIYFGWYFYWKHLREHGSISIDGVLAHEFGHRVQQDARWTYAGGESEQSQRKELEADVLSGYYLGLMKTAQWSQFPDYYAHAASIGNFRFNDRQFHGTPGQRRSAVYLGINTAIYEMNNLGSGVHYTYQQLHDYWMQVIEQDIVPNTAEVRLSRAPAPAVSELARGLQHLPLRDIAEGRSMGEEVIYPRLTLEERMRLRPAAH
jgi:hypothetical protein